MHRNRHAVITPSVQIRVCDNINSSDSLVQNSSDGLVQHSSDSLVQNSYNFTYLDQTRAAGNIVHDIVQIKNMTHTNNLFLNDFRANSTLNNSFNKYSIGAWNANGWNARTQPENQIFKENTLKCLNFDFFLISETHCLKNELIMIDGFKIFQYNRGKISNRAIKGSGGVAIAMNNKLLCNHSIISVIKGTHDGILALKVKNNDSDFLLGLVVNYLPPNTFHYGRDPEGYFTDNAVVWSDLTDCDLVVGGGDLNSRTKCDFDFIPEIDGRLIAPRTNPDNIKNSHGEYFLQFLKEQRALICNGRVTPE